MSPGQSELTGNTEATPIQVPGGHRRPDCKPRREFCLNIEGVKQPWPVSTISVEQIAEMGGWEVADGVIQVDADNNERTLQPGEIVELKPGIGFCKKVRWKRGMKA